MTRMLILAGALTVVGAPVLAQTQTAVVITNPSWISVHQPAYPTLARDHYVAAGFVRLQCTARTSGAVDACRILEETPADQGFGQEALNIMPQARIRPRTVDGRPVDSPVVQSFRFTLRDAPASSRAVEAAAEAADADDAPTP